MRTAFVTGGTGFVGSHLVEALLQRGYREVRCLVRRDLKWLAPLGIVPVRGDLTDRAVLEAAVRGVDEVYHVAGVTRATEWATFEQGNIRGTLRLLEAIRAVHPGIRKVLVTSSLAAVGRAEGVADETTPLNPISQYGRSKAQMEAALALFQADLPLVVVRPPAVYGPRETDILTFFQTVRRGICPVIGDGTQPDLSLVHVRDLVQGMIDAVASEATSGQTYFIGSEVSYAWNQVRDATAAALGRSVLTIPIPPALIEAVGAVAEVAGKLLGTYPPLNREKAAEIRHACKMCSSAKARRDFGYQPGIPLEDGIRETIAWYRAHGWL
jgi:nucleoside-diphosphate-sugar epimerase